MISKYAEDEMMPCGHLGKWLLIVTPDSQSGTFESESLCFKCLASFMANVPKGYIPAPAVKVTGTGGEASITGGVHGVLPAPDESVGGRVTFSSGTGAGGSVKL